MELARREIREALNNTFQRLPEQRRRKRQVPAIGPRLRLSDMQTADPSRRFYSRLVDMRGKKGG